MNVLSFPFPLVILLGRQKPGKWCAMHVRVAYMILRHQEKMKVLGPEGWVSTFSGAWQNLDQKRPLLSLVTA